ncbi:unnamed protein product [Auanema sp. JU1783]|nr:unnamed protein product [Auanema sp. JU1783]
MFTDNIEFIIAMVFICIYAVFYLSVASICGVVLYMSIRDQGKSTNEVYNECGSMCEPQCNMILGVVVVRSLRCAKHMQFTLQRPQGCIAVCRAGCECAAGHVRINGVCISETICRRYF